MSESAPPRIDRLNDPAADAIRAHRIRFPAQGVFQMAPAAPRLSIR